MMGRQGFIEKGGNDKNQIDKKLLQIVNFIRLDVKKVWLTQKFYTCNIVYEIQKK